MIMSTIKGSYPLEVKKITFEDGSELDNKTVVILNNGFILIEGDADECRPSMYSAHYVRKLEGVEEIRPKMKYTVV